MIKIPLDPMLDAKANAQKYFDKYNKLKRTYEALTDLTAETRTEIEHLESIATSLDIALTEDDLVQIKEELIEAATSAARDRQGKSRKSPPIRSTTALPRALTFMSARTTSRTRTFRLNSPPATTGGSTRKASRAAMSS